MLFQHIVQRTLRVPALAANPGDGHVIVRQLDSVLLSVGFKLAKGLLEHLAGLHPAAVQDQGRQILSAVRELVGDDVDHNVYFIEFPNNVPDTQEFWAQCIFDALLNPRSAGIVASQLQTGIINLLDLPKYGRYQHSYADMVAAHTLFMPSAKDRVTVLHLGGTLAEEAVRLYHSLAGSAIPLNEADRWLLAELAECCLTDVQPEAIPVRENRAIINQVRLNNDGELLVDTPTDILRLACALSEGDVTLQQVTRFKSLPRRQRRGMLTALDKVVQASPAKVADVLPYREQWKRLAERVHPGEHNLPHAHDIFAVARGDRQVKTLMGRVEAAFAAGDGMQALSLLAKAPGVLFRSLDRVLRSGIVDPQATAEAVQTVIPKVAGRVILSVREHLQNRQHGVESRLFINRKGSAWATPEQRSQLDPEVVEPLQSVFDTELLNRLPAIDRLVIDHSLLQVALPLSDKLKANGFGLLPRGSVTPVTGDILRFFMYWKQRYERTDYDLSVILLDQDYACREHVSWTNLRAGDAVHSGDIVDAPNGASEFIDLNLQTVNCRHIVPQVNVFCGESFAQAEESFFGFMTQQAGQEGKPFEPKTVRAKSDVRGQGRVALPIVFSKDDSGIWSAKWLHLYLNGYPRFNTVEANRISTALQVKSLLERQYLTFEYLVGLLRRKADHFAWYDPQAQLEGPVTFIGLEVPEDLPEDSASYSLSNLADLIPA